jgi:hypothetical protein
MSESTIPNHDFFEAFGALQDSFHVGLVRKRLQLGLESDIESCLSKYMEARASCEKEAAEGIPNFGFPFSRVDLAKIALADALLRSLDFPTGTNDEISSKPQIPKPPKQKKPARSGFVYLAKNTRNGYTKIGFSKKPKYRESCLQSEEPEVEIAETFQASMDDERHLHLCYSELRIRGEWFRLTEDHISEIKRFFDR